jgi:hypothetical protein
MRLYERQSQRQYSDSGRNGSVPQAAGDSQDRCIRTFCAMPVYSGCRISEALESHRGPRCLKDASFCRARRNVVEEFTGAVSVARVFLDTELGLRDPPTAEAARSIKEVHQRSENAWRQICNNMNRQQITGAHVIPKRLRHGFGINAVPESRTVSRTVNAERAANQRLWHAPPR